MVKKLCKLAAICVTLLAGIANAGPNLVVNGSFESGLTGWSISGSQISWLPTVVNYGAPACCFGEIVPTDNAPSLTPDPVGTHGVYFVDDVARQVLGQSVFLTAGSYRIGFDAYAPLNGFNNTGDAFFRGTIAGVTLASYTVKTQNAPQIWFNYSGLANVLADGVYSVTFEYNTSLVPSADVVIDRAYILAVDEDGGTDIGRVPEPTTLALLGLGLAGLGFSRRKQ